MNDRSRPAGAAPKSTALTTSTILTRRAWAYSLQRKCASPPPKYGTPEFLALADGSVEKVVSVVNAAEAHAIAGDNLADDLWRELDERRRLDKAHEDAEYQAAAAEHRRRWRHLRIVRPLVPRPGEPWPGDLDAS